MSHKQRRHLSVVGGSNSLPSLREVVHHRNALRKRTARRSTSAATTAQKRPGWMDAGRRERTCDLCSKVQRQWEDSDGLRKKTLVSDVTLRSVDGEKFYCNSFLLATWSKSMLENAECEKGPHREEEWVVDLDSVTGEVLSSGLRFMYGGALADIPPRHLPELVKLADDYAMDALKQACFKAAEAVPLTTDNACALLLFADEHNIPSAGDRCMRFIYANLEGVMGSSDWELVSDRWDLLMALLQASAGWTKDNPDWRSWKQEDVPSSPLVAGIRAIWRDSDALSKPHASSDVVLVAKSGRNFHIHTQIIFATSPDFAASLQEECASSDGPQVYMDDMDDDVVEEFLRFLYCQEPSSDFSQVAEFVHVLATTHRVTQLARMCERETTAHEVTDVDSAVQMLADAEEHRMPGAKAAIFRYLYGNVEKLRRHEAWIKLTRDEPQLLTDMMLESKRFRRLTGNKGNE